jgi:hypothetical protein
MIKSSANSKLPRALAYWIALVVLFTWAAWRRFSLPLDPIADPDIWGYLSPALLKLNRAEFVHLEERNFVYPGFLLMVLRGFGDFRAITIVQHLLGMAAGAIAIVTWGRVTAFLPKPSFPAGLHRCLGLLLGAVVLLAGEPIRTELQCRPEGVCAFILSLNLYFGLEFIARAYIDRSRPAVTFGIGAGVTAMILASLKPSFIFLAALAVVPIAVFICQRNPLRAKCLLGFALLTSAVVIFIPEYLLSRTDEVAHTFLATTLFTSHADLIRDQLADDLERQAPTPWDTGRLRRIHEQLKTEIDKSAAAEAWRYPSLGFSPEYLMYNPNSSAVQVAHEFNGDMAASTAVYRFYYWRCWQHRPGAMLKKITAQLALFYAPLCPAFDRGKYIPLQFWYRQSVASLDRSSQPKVWNNYQPAVESLQRSASLPARAPVIEQNKFVRRTVVFLSAAYLPFLGVTVALAVVLLLRRDYREQMGWLVLVTLFVFSYNAAVCLETAVLHSLDVPRYVTIQFYFTVLAEFLAIRLLFEAVAYWIRWGRPIQTSAPGE